jgi:urease accessory protein
MLRAESVLAAGTWTVEPVDAVVLEFDERHRRRVTMNGVRGLEFLLDLPEAVTLRSGDGLRLEDGRVVEVVAAPEGLAEIRAADASALTRIAWHLGNRHLPTELGKRSLRVRRDAVIEEMVKGLGGQVTLIEAPFNPEGGAYARAAGRDGHDHGDHDHSRQSNHAHKHGHDHHGHDHQGHDHHGPDHHSHGHAHGPDCGGDHHDH